MKLCKGYCLIEQTWLENEILFCVSVSGPRACACLQKGKQNESIASNLERTRNRSSLDWVSNRNTGLGSSCCPLADTRVFSFDVSVRIKDVWYYSCLLHNKIQVCRKRFNLHAINFSYVTYYNVSLTEWAWRVVQVASLLPKSNPKDLW